MSAAAAAMVGGGVLGAYGQMQQGFAARAAGEYNAQVAEQNAVLSLQQAKEEERRFRTTFKRQLGDMRANYGASGLQMEGSPLEVMEDSVARGEMDAIAIRHAGETKAYAFRNEARMQRYQGAMGFSGAQFGAAASLLTAGGRASGYAAKGES